MQQSKSGLKQSSQLLLKLEEQRQQAQQLETAFFETQDRCNALEGRVSELTTLLAEARQRKLSEMDFEFNQQIVQVLKQTALECDLNNAAVEAVGIQLADLSGQLVHILPQQAAFDRYNQEFAADLRLKIEAGVSLTSINQLFARQDNTYAQQQQLINQLQDDLSASREQLRAREAECEDLRQHLTFQKQIASRSDNDRDDLLKLIQNQSKQVQLFKEQFQEREEQLTFYREKYEQLNAQKLADTETISNYKALFEELVADDDQKNDRRQSIDELLVQQQQLKNELLRFELHNQSLQETIDVTLQKVMTDITNRALEPLEAVQDPFYQSISQTLIRQFTSLSTEFARQNVENNRFLNGIETDYQDVFTQMTQLKRSDNNLEVKLLTDNVEKLKSENAVLQIDSAKWKKAFENEVQAAQKFVQAAEKKQQIILKEIDSLQSTDFDTALKQLDQRSNQEVQKLELFASEGLRIKLKEDTRQAAARLSKLRQQVQKIIGSQVDQSVFTLDQECMMVERDLHLCVNINKELGERLISQNSQAITSSPDQYKQLVSQNQDYLMENIKLKQYRDNAEKAKLELDQLKQLFREKLTEQEGLENAVTIVHREFESAKNQTIFDLAKIHCVIKEQKSLREITYEVTTQTDSAQQQQQPPPKPTMAQFAKKMQQMSMPTKTEAIEVHEPVKLAATVAVATGFKPIKDEGEKRSEIQPGKEVAEPEVKAEETKPKVEKVAERKEVVSKAAAAPKSAQMEKLAALKAKMEANKNALRKGAMDKQLE